jgi:hypothetical protein
VGKFFNLKLSTVKYSIIDGCAAVDVILLCSTQSCINTGLTEASNWEGGGGSADPEAVYSLCLILKIML